MLTKIKEELSDYTVEVFDTISSTNTYLTRLAKKEKIEKRIAVALEQTGGRGRMGRTFHSPRGAGLYMSLLYPLSDVSECEGLTVRVGVALFQVLEKRFPTLSPTLKWVNDIYIGDKKLAGILVEGVTRVDGKFCAVIGIGMNVLACAFPDDLRHRVTSIESETGEQLSPLSFVRELTKEIEEALATPFSSLLALYREHSYLKGKDLLVLPHSGEAYSAVYVDVDEKGGLLVKKEDGEIVTLSSGDVSVKPT